MNITMYITYQYMYIMVLHGPQLLCYIRVMVYLWY